MNSAVTSTPNPATGARLESARRELNLFWFSALALGIGIVTGFGAVVFRALIGIVHNLFYYGQFAVAYDANRLEPPSPWGAFIILSPIVGGLIVVFLVKTFAPEAKGHGVPEVMDAVFYNQGRIRGVVAIVKSLASAISIGSGAAVGREGPIIQIGSSLGSTMGRWLNLSRWQTITLLSAGAGAGIAATFNTPLGGVLFALEILLPEVSNRTFLPVVIATGAATYIGRLLIGPEPAFLVPDVSLPAAGLLNVADLLALAFLGAACGVAAWAFIKLLAWAEDWFPALPGGDYVQNILGMGIVGVLMYAFTLGFGHPYVNGVGYGVIQSVLDGHMALAWLLFLLFAAKLVATSASLGSGASGGIFSPSLFLGATLGGGFGAIIHMLLPGSGLTAPVGAIIGMAAIVGAGTGAVMTAIVMIFEMTLDYSIIVPVILAVAVAAGIRRSLIQETIYTIKLRHRGHRIPKERHINLYLVQQAKDVMEAPVILAKSGTPLRAVLGEDPREVLPPIVVERDGRIMGLVPPRSGLWAAALRDPSIQVDAFAGQDYVLARDTDLMSRVFARLRRHGRGAVIVFRGEGRPRSADIAGVITKRAIADAVIGNFSD